MSASFSKALTGPVARFGVAVLLTAAAAGAGVAMAQSGAVASGPGAGMGPGMGMAIGMGPGTRAGGETSMGGHAGHGAHGGPGMVLGGGWMALEGRGLDRLLDSVQATEAQRALIRQIAEAARTDLRSQRQGATALRERALNALAQPTLDAREWEAVRQAQLAQHTAASQRMSKAVFDMAAVLTPDQRAQLAARMKERSARWEQRHGERPASRS